MSTFIELHKYMCVYKVTGAQWGSCTLIMKEECVVMEPRVAWCLAPLSFSLSASVAFVWQTVRQKNTPAQYSENPTLAHHNSYMCIYVWQLLKIIPNYSVRGKRVCNSWQYLTLLAYVTRGSGVEVVGDIYRAP